jgi:hypothetical protein
MKPIRELHMMIEATPNEVIAINAAIHYYLTYFHRPTEEFQVMRTLLLQFHQRLVEQSPTIQTPLPPVPQRKR